jgi:hypothetical protein
MNFGFFQVNIGKVIGDIKARFKIHAPVDVEIAKKEINAENIVGSIGEQRNVNIQTLIITGSNPEALSEELRGLLGQAEQLPPPAVQSDSPSPSPSLPAPEEENELVKKLLHEYVEGYTNNATFLSGAGQLLYIYENRTTITFSEDELTFLFLSSLKNDFPYWFWCFTYREQYGHVVPLLLRAYQNANTELKMKLVKVFSNFTETEDELTSLAESERNEDVLGTIVIELSKKHGELAQRVLSNALSRQLVPRVSYEKIADLNAPLGPREKQFLHKIIAEGWPEEKADALNVLSVAADKTDLALIESIISDSSYQRAVLSALHCIIKIGETTMFERLLELLKETRQEEVFLQLLVTLKVLNNKAAFPEIFKLVKDPESIYWRFSELNKWTYERKLEETAGTLFGSSHYDMVIEDILSKKFMDEHWYNWVWRQMFFLKHTTNPEIKSLIEKETRLDALSEWTEVVQAVKKESNIESDEPEELRAKVSKDDFKLSMFALRKLWEVISPDEVLNEREKIENLRTNLEDRLSVLVSNQEVAEEAKGLLRNGLDFFLGENTLFYEKERDLTRKVRKERDEKGPLATFFNDVSWFDAIEREFVKAASKSEKPEVRQFLKSQIGRPHEQIYDAIDKKLVGSELSEWKALLENVVENEPNTLTKLNAIDAGVRIGAFNRSDMRIKVLSMLGPVRDELKRTHRMKHDSWFVTYIVYNACINTLSAIGDSRDILLVLESIEKEIIIGRNYGRLSGFYSIEAVKELLEIMELAVDDEERESAKLTLDNLDYAWTRELLSIEQ